jgi:glycosyltransferase involved in cell wall biosynthesis
MSHSPLMRVLQVVPTYLPAHRYGGPIVAVHGLAKALVALGHRVDVFTTNVDGDGILDVATETPVCVDGVQVTYFPSPFSRLYWSPAMRAALAESIGNYEVVHVHSVFLWPGVAACAAARRAGIPYIISPRGMLVPELIRQRSHWIKMAWLRLIERRSFAHATAIHFTSRLEWEDAKRVDLPLPSPFVVANGIDVEARPDVAREERMLVFLGRVNWKKGLETVIEVLPRLEGVRFVVVGNDEEGLTPRLRALAERLGVGDRVELAGPLYGSAKTEILSRATLFVLLSRSENFGNAVLEALAMETPVVLSAQVGLADEIRRAGAGEIGIDAIAALLSDPVRRAEMGRRGRALVQSHFGWPRIAGEMEETYRCSIASRPSS